MAISKFFKDFSLRRVKAEGSRKACNATASKKQKESQQTKEEQSETSIIVAAPLESSEEVNAAHKSALYGGFYSSVPSFESSGDTYRSSAPRIESANLYDVDLVLTESSSSLSTGENVYTSTVALSPSAPAPTPAPQAVSYLSALHVYASSGEHHQAFETLRLTQNASKSALLDQAKPRSWNTDFQEILDLPDGIEKYARLERLSSEFTDTAATYARIIVSELGTDAKTVRPVGIGGIAGGVKYIARGILFKFSLDVRLHDQSNTWMFGGNAPDDEAAIKAAAKELTGLQAYYTSRVPNLHYPLMSIIDYKGFRVIASALLPIGKDTIIYGSDDAGATVHADDEEMNQLMRSAAQRLQLTGHVVGRGNAAREIWGPGDIEGHRGTDGRFYVCDFGRIMPPEDPRRNGSNPRAVYYQHLRPELLRRYAKEGLCSDAFTAWDSDLDARTAHNAAVASISHLLHNEVIPKIGRFMSGIICTKFVKLNESGHWTFEYISEMLDMLDSQNVHEKGINMRHIGVLRSHTTAQARMILLCIGVSRCLKSEGQQMMRQVMRSAGSASSSDAPFLEIMVAYIRCFLDHNNLSFWGDHLKKKLCERYPGMLSDEEMRDDFDLKAAIEIRLVFVNFLRLIGLKISKKAMDHFIAKPHSFMLLLSDIEAMAPRVKSMFIVSESAGMHTLLAAQEVIKSMTENKQADGAMYRSSAVRLLRAAEGHFFVTHNRVPMCPMVPYRWGRAIEARAFLARSIEGKVKHYERAARQYERSLGNWPTPFATRALAVAWMKLAHAYREQGHSENATKYEALAREKACSEDASQAAPSGCSSPLDCTTESLLFFAQLERMPVCAQTEDSEVEAL